MLLGHLKIRAIEPFLMQQLHHGFHRHIVPTWSYWPKVIPLLNSNKLLHTLSWPHLAQPSSQTHRPSLHHHRLSKSEELGSRCLLLQHCPVVPASEGAYETLTPQLLHSIQLRHSAHSPWHPRRPFSGILALLLSDLQMLFVVFLTLSLVIGA